MEVFSLDNQPGQEICLPFFDAGVAAGEPAYVSEYFEERINLSSELIPKPQCTFCVRVQGQSMLNAGIHDGDLLIVEKDREANPGQIVLAVVNGNYTVKRLAREGHRHYLKAENPDYPHIYLDTFDDCRIWGVVTGVIRKTV